MNLTYYNRLKERVGGFPLLITAIIVIFVIYLAVSTRWIPSYGKINTTDIYNNTIEIDSVYSYSYTDYITKEASFEQTNPQIPKNSFEIGEVFTMILLIISLYISLLRMKETKQPASIEEIREETAKYMNYMKGAGKIKEYDMKEGGILKHRQLNSGEKIPDSWLVPVDVSTIDGDEEYRVVGFNPYTKRVIEDYKTDKEFRGEDKCPECGMFYHEKIIDISGYKDWDSTFGKKIRI